MSKLPVITDARVEQYMLDLVDSTGQKGLPADAAPVFNEMEALADRTHFPIVGPHVGRALGMHAGLIGARRIVDLGCGFGYEGFPPARRPRRGLFRQDNLFTQLYDQGDGLIVSVRRSRSKLFSRSVRTSHQGSQPARW